MAPPSVIAIKQSFVSSQTRLLAQPLAPSRAWRATNPAGDDGIPERALDEALVRVNQALLQHERRVHPLQATRHVAEQIDQLYWNTGKRAVDVGDGVDGGMGAWGVGTDFGSFFFSFFLFYT
jgi:hypothetical protein